MPSLSFACMQGGSLHATGIAAIHRKSLHFTRHG